MRIVLAVVVVVLVLLGAAVVMAPARVVLDRVAADSEGGLAFEDVRGTVWRGHAGRVLSNGEDIGSVDWVLLPGALLQRAIEADVAFRSPQLQARGRLRTRDEMTWLSAVDAEFSAELLAPVLAPLALHPAGTIELDLERLDLRAGLPVALAGEARWRDAVVTGAGQAELGLLEARFDTRPDGSVAGTLGDREGPLGLQGEFELSWLGYRLEAVLTPHTPRVAAVLAGVGFPGVDGRRELALQGRWLATGEGAR